jgi:hypothetical protein
VSTLESGYKFNTGYYVSKMSTPFTEWWCERGGGNFGKLIVDAENARSRSSSWPGTGW